MTSKSNIASRPSKLGYAIVAALIAGLGASSGASQAAPEETVAGVVRVEASQDMLRDCGLAGRGAERFVVKRPEAGTRTIEMCGGNDLATARALSLALDEASASRIESGPLTPQILNLRLMRARAEVESRSAKAR